MKHYIVSVVQIDYYEDDVCNDLYDFDNKEEALIMMEDTLQHAIKRVKEQYSDVSDENYTIHRSERYYAFDFDDTATHIFLFEMDE